MIGKAATLAVAVLAAAAAGGSPAESAFPGANGRIVFQRGAPYDGGPTSLYLVNPNGTGLVRLTKGYQHDAQPSWSPDGSRIAFESTRRGDTDVYVIRPDGSSLKELTFSRGFDGDPAWSDDGAAGSHSRRPATEARHLRDQRGRNRRDAADRGRGGGRRSRVVARRHAHRLHERPHRPPPGLGDERRRHGPAQLTNGANVGGAEPELVSGRPRRSCSTPTATPPATSTSGR